MSSITFIEGQGPMIMTCRNHDKGTDKIYIHPPRNSDHILPSLTGDQLCHAVIKPRTISRLKASKHCTTYQMHEQHGSFQGVDTCDVTTYRDFSFCSMVLDEHELKSIACWPDINSLLLKLGKENVLCRDTISSMKNRENYWYSENEIKVEKCLHGSTYVSLDDVR